MSSLSLDCCKYFASISSPWLSMYSKKASKCAKVRLLSIWALEGKLSNPSLRRMSSSPTVLLASRMNSIAFSLAIFLSASSFLQSAFRSVLAASLACSFISNYYIYRWPYSMTIIIRTAILLLLLLAVTQSNPADDLKAKMIGLKEERQLRGVQLQLSQEGEVVFNLNLGEKNEALEPIDNNTVFRIASISKSFSSVALLQLVEQGKLSLNQSLSSIFGYTIQNPHFPGQPITVEMLLSHQSSLVECQPYYTNFLIGTSRAQTGSDVPNIKQILIRGGRFYNDCLFSSSHRPGSYFDYVNLNFGVAGTIVQILSQQRFDLYVRENILKPISEGLAEVATFYPFTINNTRNLGVIYEGENGKWVPTCDNYPTGKIPERNLTGYRIGSNGVVFGPQGSLRASAAHLTNYAIMLASGGKTKSGKVILSPSSVDEITKCRYLFRGKEGGEDLDFHNYGFGLFRTTYRWTDTIIPHQVVIGHIGDAYGLLSGLHFWGKYTLTYIISGSLDGYRTDKGTIYEYERMAIHSAAAAFFQASSRFPREL